MFSSAHRETHIVRLSAELAEKRVEAHRLHSEYHQVASSAQPATELTAAVAKVEPDRRERFFGEFLRSLILRDRPDDVRLLILSKPFLLQFADVHRGMTGRQYAASLDRTEVLRVLDEAEGAIEQK